MSAPYAEVIGDPISHSRSPLIHGYWLARLGLAGDYRTCHVKPDDLETYFADRRADPDWRGCNVTIPHKEKVAAFLDDVDARGCAVGAVNTVFRSADGALHGTNTDVDGVAEALRGFDLAGRRVVVLGAGGAARAAFFHLAGMGCAVSVLARNQQRAQMALEQCGLGAVLMPFAARTGAFEDAALVINTTQLGMTGQDPMPRFVLDEIDQTAGDALVFDMVYSPRETGLLKAAGLDGRATVGGLAMLVGQARTAFVRFFGTYPSGGGDAELMRKLAA